MDEWEYKEFVQNWPYITDRYNIGNSNTLISLKMAERSEAKSFLTQSFASLFFSASLSHFKQNLRWQLIGHVTHWG